MNPARFIPLGGLIVGILGCPGCFLSTLAYVAIVPVHELGHALVWWLSGYFAVPAPFITIRSEEFSWVVATVVFGILVALLVWAVRKSKRLISVLCTVLLCAQLILTLFVSERFATQAGIAGGLLGEAILGALMLVLVISSSVPTAGNWIMVAFIGAMSLGQSVARWVLISMGLADLPMGALLAFSQDDGDLNRLIDVYGWNRQFIVAFFLTTAIASSICVLLVVAVQIFRREARRVVA